MRVKWVLTLALVAATAAGCARITESRLNPFNWFGGSREVDRSSEFDIAARVDNRGMMDQVTELRIERVPGGAIVRATGLPPTQGYWDGGLVPTTRDEVPENGTLTYEFRVYRPAAPTRVSTPRSREVIVGRFVSNQTLEGVRQIRVVATRNARAVSR